MMPIKRQKESRKEKYRITKLFLFIANVRKIAEVTVEKNNIPILIQTDPSFSS